MTLAVLSALLLWASFPPLGFAPLGWVALAPLMVALRGATPREGLRRGFVCGFLFFAASACWLWRLFSWRSPGLWAFEALFPALFGFLAAGRKGLAWTLLGVPALWVGTEWLRAEANPLPFGWFVLGLSQSSWAVALQAADLAGAYGLSLLLASASAALVHRPRLLALGIAGAAVAYGVWARGHWRTEGRIPAAVVQTEGEPRLSPQASLVVWPELALPYDPDPAPRVPGAVLVAGCVGGEYGKGGWRNRALVVDPAGKVLGDYVKHVRVPFFDDGVEGTGFPVFDSPAGRLGVCICYDLDHPWVARGLCRAGAEVLAVPTMDPKAWGGLQHAQHTANARAWAVVHRRFVLRACSSGISQVLAPDGRVLAEVADMEEGAAAAKVAPVEPLSPCDAGGWLLAPLCALWAGAALFLRRA